MPIQKLAMSGMEEEALWKLRAVLRLGAWGVFKDIDVMDGFRFIAEELEASRSLLVILGLDASAYTRIQQAINSVISILGPAYVDADQLQMTIDQIEAES